jgi:NAD(P)-dependent dehydrogenase (short-subunit alcohol dehydrogenase family)
MKEPNFFIVAATCPMASSSVSFATQHAKESEIGQHSTILDQMARLWPFCAGLRSGVPPKGVIMKGFPSFDLNGRVALVTGAARGLGNAISQALAHAGADVALGLRDIRSGGEVAATIEKMGRRVLPLQMDTAHMGQIHAAIEDTVARFGRLDILVNNAGVGPENPAELVREEDFDFTVNVNLKGTFFACQAAARHMIGQKFGRIINMGSQAGFVALPTESIYCMTKAAISHLTKCLAVEWGKHNITVNAVAPTFIATPGTEPALADPKFKADVTERIAALHRIGEPMEVAGAVVFLASPAASLITGDTILIDGGWTAR